MGPAVGVHIFGEFRQTIGARLPGEDLRFFEERRRLRGFGELGAEGAVGAEGGLAGDQRSAGDVPEGAGPSIAQHDLIAVGNLKELRQAFAYGGHDLFDGRLPVRRAQQVAGAVVKGLDLFGADLARSRTETSVFRQQFGRNGHGIRHGS